MGASPRRQQGRQVTGCACCRDGAGRPAIRYGGIVRDKLIFMADVVRYHGDLIAAVAADNVDIAEEALHLIEVEIEALPALIDPR